MTLMHETVGDEPMMNRLDADNGDAFRAAVEAHLTDDAKVVFDLHRIELVDSSGLGAILALLKRIVAEGGDLKLCELTPRLQTLFERARLPQILEIHATRDEAVRSYDGVS